VAAAVGGPLIHRQEQRLALGVAAAALLVLGAAPLLALLAEIAAGWHQALAALASARPLALLLRSLALALVVTALSLAGGIPLGVLVGRTDARGRGPALLLHAFPVFLPPFLLALGWFQVLGVRGLAGSPATSGLLFSEVGVALVLAATFTPIATILVALGLQAVDPGLEEAARVAARPLRVVAQILLPAAAPAIALTALTVFSLSLSELGVPMFLRVDTFPAAVFARLGGVDYAPGEALALVLPLVPVVVALLAFERRFVGTRSFAVLGLRSGARERLPLGRWRAPASAALWLVAALSLTPVAALVWRGASGEGFAEAGSWLGRAPWNSLWTGSAAATLIVAIGLVVGHGVARRAAGARSLDTLCVLTFVAPAAVLGVGLIAVWNRPALQWVYGSAGILVVGYVARYAVIGVRTMGSLVAQTPVHVEEAAAAVGAGFGRRLFRILLPLHARGVGFAWLLALVFCLRDLELAVLYYPAGGEPLTVRIFTLEANGPEPVVAALAVAHVAMTAAVLGAGGWLLKRSVP
jgi:iron(III) transport system permease protein